MMFPSSDKCIVAMEDLNNLENWMRVQGNSMHYPQHFVNTKLFQNKNIFFSFFNEVKQRLQKEEKLHLEKSTSLKKTLTLFFGVKNFVRKLTKSLVRSFQQLPLPAFRILMKYTHTHTEPKSFPNTIFKIKRVNGLRLEAGKLKWESRTTPIS